MKNLLLGIIVFMSFGFASQACNQLPTADKWAVYSKKCEEIRFYKICKYELYNSMGQIILKGEDDKVNVGWLSQGIYILRTENNIQKFFIN